MSKVAACASCGGATDSRNNTTEKQAKVTIVDTGATKEGPMDFDGKKQYVRFIAADYYLKQYAGVRKVYRGE